ncbi:hypothetical protein KI387_013738, partial [Taxus chinensis]
MVKAHCEAVIQFHPPRVELITYIRIPKSQAEKERALRECEKLQKISLDEKKNCENRLSPCPRNIWDIRDTKARFGRNASKRPAKHWDKWNKCTRKDAEPAGSAEREEKTTTAQDIWGKRTRTDPEPAEMGVQMDVENRPVRETAAQGQVGQRDARDADSRRSRKPIRSQPRVTGRKGTRKPISGGSEDFVPRSTGTFGTKGRGGRENPAGPWTNHSMTRVAKEK